MIGVRAVDPLFCIVGGSQGYVKQRWQVDELSDKWTRGVCVCVKSIPNVTHAILSYSFLFQAIKPTCELLLIGSSRTGHYSHDIKYWFHMLPKKKRNYSLSHAGQKTVDRTLQSATGSNSWTPNQFRQLHTLWGGVHIHWSMLIFAQNCPPATE